MIDEPIDFTFPIIGSLQFASMGTRPDKSCAGSAAVKYIAAPNLVHCNGILKYLKATMSLRLLFIGTSAPNVLIAYADADFAMDLDDRRSRTGIIVLFLTDALGVQESNAVAVLLQLKLGISEQRPRQRRLCGYEEYWKTWVCLNQKLQLFIPTTRVQSTSAQPSAKTIAKPNMSIYSIVM